MNAFHRHYGDQIAALIIDGEPPDKAWLYTDSGERCALVQYSQLMRAFPIFAPRSGRYADIRASIIGFEQSLRRKLERRADELRRCLDPEWLDEHGPTADKVEAMRRELESVGEQIAELAQEE